MTLGEITGHHGVKGWVKVKSYTRPIEQIFDYPEWYLSEKRANRIRSNWVSTARLGPLRLKSSQASGKALVACLGDVESRSEAEGFIGKMIQVPEEALPELDSGEYYWSQLIGLQVENTEGIRLGQVDHLLETGANDVLVVTDKGADGEVVERLLPWTDHAVIRVDLERSMLLVDWDPEF